MSERTRTIRIGALARVEGEGALHLQIRDGHVEQCQLQIYEPPRFFEAFLRGRELEQVPDLVARICGICPVAYQMSAVHALEQALEVQVTPEIRTLRRLLYCGEWIESHTLHMHLLHAPDFLGYASGLDIARDYPEEVQRGLRLKKHANALLAVLGGRAIHPVSVAVGGFHRLPSRHALSELIPDFEWGLEAAVATARWVAGFAFPDFQMPYDMVALVHPEEYPMNEGQIGSLDAPPLAVERFEAEFHEAQVPHSTALQAVRTSTGGAYMVGPLARVNLNLERLSPTARRVADEVGIDWPCRNPFQSIVARALEVIHAYEEALEILKTYDRSSPSRIRYTPRQASGCAATEAPRGLLYHHYEIDAEGLVSSARIVPPTSQNQAQIEQDLRCYASGVTGDDEAASDAEIGRRCEHLVRSYDPCISCSTHFLKVHIERVPQR